MELKNRLTQLRRERGYTLRELRDRIERETGERMSFSYLSSLERVGRTPSIEALTHIAAGYGISVQALLAPVDFDEALASSRYPPSLLEFAGQQNLSSDWLDTLASIQFRGERPSTVTEWAAIYGVLYVLPSGKGKVNG